MPRVPGWKIRRELGRIRQQLQAIPEAIWEPLAQARHDRDLAERWPVHQGAHPGADKIAVVLIWQPHGVAESLYRLIGHLNDNGHAVFVVSNTHVSVSDAAQLEKLVWKWMERPNFGYDFGGYRDAVRLLRSWQTDPERLVILNDSTWFPLHDGDETLSRFEALKVDIAGSILRRKNATEFLESYAFSVSSRAWRSEAFAAYWDGLRITSNKYKVIRRGERGFSASMAASGLAVRPLFTRKDFDRELAGMNTKELREAIRFGATTNEEIEARRTAIAENPAGREECLFLIAKMLDKGLFYSSFPVISNGRMRYPFLKKSGDKIGTNWRKRYVQAVETGIIDAPNSTLWAEILKRDRNA